MIARIQKSVKDRDQGFTLIELLVVMIIIGILAAIAVPVFLNQRKKAVDTAAKSDISGIGKELATYFVDGTGNAPALTIVDSQYQLGATKVGRVSLKTAPTALNAQGTASNYCVSFSYVDGTTSPQTASYSATQGLQLAACPAVAAGG